MKQQTIYKAFLLVIGIALVISAIAEGSSSRPITKAEQQVINTNIRKLRQYDPRFPGGNFLEAEGARIYLFGTIDNHPSIAVQFTMLGGNVDYQYLLVYDRMKRKVARPVRIGGRGYRDIKIHHIDSNTIHACAVFYGPNDSMPNPSVPGIVIFAIDWHNEIVEDFTVVNVENSILDCNAKP